MALSFIGKSISLISHSDVRYRGILAGIDPQASTIQLSNVYSMGTEQRRPPNQFIPPVAEPYQYIIFKAAEVKDLAVDETTPPPPRRNVHDDPAVMASAPLASNAYNAYGAAPIPPQIPPQQAPPQGYAPHQPQPQAPQQPPPVQQQAVPQQQQPPAATASPSATATQATASGAPSQTPTAPRNQNRRPNPVHSAAASLETVERALGDLRIANAQNAASVPVNNHTNAHGGRGGRRGGHGRGGARDGGDPQIKVPTTDFDFESMNAKFDKAALAAAAGPKEETTGEANGPKEEEGEAGASGEATKEKAPVAYNPQKSFFDTLSSSANTPSEAPRGGRGRGGRGGGRARREEEREKNVATFGEPGGVGLMGPGAYVGGWGGYGRRGGRGRRGGGRGGSNHVQAVPTRG